jgi:hypothetical protein
MKKTITFILFLAVSAACYSQSVTRLMSYNGPGNQVDKSVAMVTDQAANCYVTGYSWGSNSTKEDFATQKYNADGVLQWTARYDGPGHNLDMASAIAVDNSGNVYVTGWSRTSGDFGSEDFCTIKYNSAGQQQWAARYDGALGDCYYYDYARAIVVDNSGNVYVTGQSWGNDNVEDDYLTIKYNSSGAVQWAKRYNGPSAMKDIAYSLAVDASGNTYVTGGSQANGKGFDMLTIKYGPSGSQLWTARYDAPAFLDDIACEIKVDGQGNAYITGSSHGGTTKLDYATIKYNTSGQQQWLKRYTNSATNDTDAATGIDIDIYGNVYVTGYSKGPVTGTSTVNYDYATIKYNGTDGSPMWINRVDGGFSEKAWDIKVINKRCQSGDPYELCWDVFLFITGETNRPSTGQDIMTIAYNEFGDQRWRLIYNSSGSVSDGAAAISTNAAHNVIYCAGSFGNDYGIIGITDVRIAYSPANRSRVTHNYPNPFNPATNIMFSLQNAGKVKITVYDVLGKVVSELLDQNMDAGDHSVLFDASNLTSGVYLYSIQTKQGTEIRKMVLLK